MGEVVSPDTCFEAVEMSLAIFEKIFDLAASVTAFLFLIFDHLLCPLIPLEAGLGQRALLKDISSIFQPVHIYIIALLETVTEASNWTHSSFLCKLTGGVLPR